MPANAAPQYFSKKPMPPILFKPMPKMVNNQIKASQYYFTCTIEHTIRFITKHTIESNIYSNYVDAVDGGTKWNTSINRSGISASNFGRQSQIYMTGTKAQIYGLSSADAPIQFNPTPIFTPLAPYILEDTA